MAAEAKIRRRILVGAGCFADARPAMGLAERLGGEICGLMVADLAVIEASGLPAQRLITAKGDLLEPPSPERQKRQIAADARAFRAELVRLAELSGQTADFQQATGDLVASVISDARQWDVVVIGHRRLRGHSGRVVVLTSPSETTSEAVGLAEELASALGISGMHLEVSANGIEAVFREVARRDIAALVLPIELATSLGSGTLMRLLEASRAPLVLVGPEEINRPEGG
ncbi:MAG: hypothetical protein HUJ27_01575 [Rhodobacteraceae bacterium]|nr:hypothetical protein [Paracoccaceae bacterium]